MTIQDALNTASLRLKNLCENPSKVARILLGFHLNTSFERIFLDAKKDLNDPQAFFKLVKRYENYEPLEYITQKAEFYSRDFEMSKGVLIARSETEILVDK
ncbi:MAG: peptide chain release factor N(5)-glutamine methyltransferase, partial [Campylobacter sp.]|nr:peptide chain release factor N(5)-glutamine methyltransferase [Campylobacter sp.]